MRPSNSQDLNHNDQKHRHPLASTELYWFMTEVCQHLSRSATYIAGLKPMIIQSWVLKSHKHYTSPPYYTHHLTMPNSIKSVSINTSHAVACLLSRSRQTPVSPCLRATLPKWTVVIAEWWTPSIWCPELVYSAHNNTQFSFKGKVSSKMTHTFC